MTSSRATVLGLLDSAGREFSNAAVLFHAAVSSRMGITPVEEKTLDLLQRVGPLTAGEIGQHTGLAPASVTGLLDRLQAKGYVRRRKDAGDGRRVVAEILPGLDERFAPLFAPLGRALAELYESYTDEELAVLLDFLSRSAAAQREVARALNEESQDAR
jgi:DNA-binding MarR family transcriptional regulator